MNRNENQATNAVSSMRWFAKPFSYEFDETGGYDCMTCGFHIYNGKHERLLTIDGADYGQGRCAYTDIPEEAENVAKWIVDMANA